MNKIYRLVWSSTQKAWVVAGEFAGARGKGTSSLRLAKRVGGLSGFVAAALIAFPADAWVAGGGTSSTALDNNNATNTSINGGVATGSGNATAIGPTATSTGSSSTAIGQLANATAVDSIALGHSASSTIVNGIAIGSGAKASGGNGAMAIGAQAAASSDGAIAFGSNAVATNTNSTAIGRSSVANGYSSVSIGDMANTTPDHSTAIGGGAAVTGLEGTSIGWYANTAGTQSQALGYYANAAGALSTAVGPKANTLGDYSIAMGSTATTTGNYGIAVGAAATSAANSLAIGMAAKATGSEAIVLGENAATAVDRSIAIGTSAGIGGVASASPVGGATTGNIAIGSTAGQNVKDDGVNMGGANVGIGTSAGNNVTGRGNQAIGKSAGNTVVGNDNFATGFGAGSNVSGSWNVAQGINAGTNVTGNNNLVYGSSAGQNVTGGDNIAIGQGAGNSITTSGTLAMGWHANASQNNAAALGAGSVATAADAIALGSHSNASRVGMNGGKELFSNTAVASALGAVSVGDAGSERQITNVAGGTQSTDAVNVRQLQAVSDSSVHYDDNPDGTVNYNSVTMGGPIYNTTTHTGGTKITNVADGSDPSDAVNFSQLTNTNNTINNIYATGTKYFHANSTGTDSSATGIDAVAIGMGAVADVARSVALGDGAKTEAAVATTGTNIAGTDYAFAGTAPVGTVSIGDVGSERTLTNLAAGSLSATSTDGINGSQLFATNSAISNLDAGSVKYDTNVDGSVNYNSVTMGGDTYNSTTHTGGTKITNVADGSDPSDAVNFSQLTTTNNNVTNLGDEVNNIYATGTKYFHANSTGTDSSATGTDAVAIGMGAVADVAHSVALGDGSKTQAAESTSGTTLLGVDYAFAGTSPVGTVSIGDAGSERTLTNLAAGRLSETSTDGVNGSQLFATNTALNSVTSSVTNLDAGTVHYDKYVDGTVNYNSVTMGGDTYDNSTHTGGTKITNVADGSDPSDAVNFSQLTNTNNNINNIYATGTKYFHANSTGTDSSATGIDAVAIGMGAVADVARSVALGDGATTQEVVATTGTTLLGTDYAFAGAAPIGTVSIGSAGQERTLTNVAAGRLSADSTDGVNGSQLFATNQALNSLDISFTDLDNHTVKYDTNVDGSVNYNNITLGGDTYNSTTHTGGTKITNIADGTAPSDAVNFSQLTETNNSINNVYSNGTKYFHANSTGADSSATGADAVAIGQSATASAMNSIAIGNGAEASTASSVALGDGAKTQTAVGTSGITIQGQNYAFAGSAPVGTVSVGDAGAERTITNVAAGQVTATSTDAVNGSQLYAVADAVNNIGGDITNLDNRSVKYDVNNDGTTNYNKITLAGDSTTITNVAAGTQDNDAVNFAQLEVVSTQVTNISNGTDGMFQVNNTSNLPKPKPTGKDSTAGGAGAVASGDNSVALGSNSSATASNSVALGSNSVADRDNTVSMGSAGHERQITNVAAGTSGTDAVNVNQLKSGIADANQYTDNKFGDLKNLVDDNKDKLSAGIAGAMAMASLPQPYAPGASMVSMGGGTYQNQSAVALGVSAISDNGKWVTKLSGTTNSQGDLGAAVGVGYQW